MTPIRPAGPKSIDDVIAPQPPNPIKTQEAITSAFRKASSPSESDSFYLNITGSEMRDIIEAARSDDGRVSRDEAIFIGRRLQSPLLQQEPEAAAEAQKLFASHQLTPGDLWK